MRQTFINGGAVNDFETKVDSSHRTTSVKDSEEIVIDDEPPSYCRKDVFIGTSSKLSSALLSLVPTVTLFCLLSLIPSAEAQSTPIPTCTSEPQKHNAVFAVEAALIPILVLSSGVIAGLTLGYMSLDMTQLAVLEKTGSPKQQRQAKAIMPIRKDSHRLLVTLLLANMAINETLPVISDGVLGGGLQAVIVSTVLIVIFSEIIPQSVCSRYSLQIGSFMVWPTRILLWTFFIVAWPVAKLLTFILGPHAGIIYRRAELKEFISMHGDTGGHGGDLKPDTITIVGATLDLQEKTAREAMTPLKEVFMLDRDKTRLDYETLRKILEAGHSRIPVYETLTSNEKGQTEKRKILGTLLTKQFILVDPEDAIPLSNLPLHPIPFVSENQPLLLLLNTFQEGRSHLAVVAPRKPGFLSPRTSQIENPEEEIKKEKSLLKTLFKRENSKDSDIDMEKATETLVEDPSGKDGKEKVLGNHHGASWTSLQGLILDEEDPLGIITLEDVLEEMIGEEILDETDLGADGRVALKPYIPPEAEELPKPEIKKSFTKPLSNAPSKSILPLPLPFFRNITIARNTPTEEKSNVLGSNSTTTEKVDTNLSLLSVAANRLAMTRSRSMPGRRRSTTDSELIPVNSPLNQELKTGDQLPLMAEPLDLIKEQTDSSSEEGGRSASPKLERRRSLDDIRRNESSVTSPSHQSVPPLLQDALLIERGRRKLISKGQELSTVNLRLPTGTSITPSTKTLNSEGNTSIPPNSNSSTSSTRPKTFKTLQPGNLPIPMRIEGGNRVKSSTDSRVTSLGRDSSQASLRFDTPEDSNQSH